MIHVRFEGTSIDLRPEQLKHVGNWSDQAIKAEVARHLKVRPERLGTYVVDRPVSGNIIVRPQAIYG